MAKIKILKPSVLPPKCTPILLNIIRCIEENENYESF
jgi:hypothetical protein